jgi:myo-inositol 2-dehydrogenase / D-chiro-inositol 1-dehydrogenase
MITSPISRRRFVKASSASLAAMGLPAIVASQAFAKNAPGDTLCIGCIGTGRMGHGDMSECLRGGMEPSVNARVVAVCDVDRLRAEHARREVEAFYAQQQPRRGSTSIALYGDFRELLSRDDIDGVTISTPDHWHAPLAIAAAEAGKDIYLQKPLTHTIHEGQKLVSAVRRKRVVLQTGSQQRSDRNFRRACELVRNGRIGKLHTIRVLLPTDSGTGDPNPMTVPENLNFDMWLGPAPEQSYTEDRVHPQVDFGRPGWLQVETYCRGMITGWGSHMFDIAQWARGSDDSGPVEMVATADFPDRGLFNVHTTFKAEGRYADGVKLIAETGTPPGVRFEGDAGWLAVGRSQLDAQPGAILRERIGEDEIRLHRSDNHMLNFLHCMRTRQDPICPVEVGHRSNSICLIAHIAMKLGRKLHWNPQAEQFVNDDEANAMLDYDHRSPWTI